MKKQQPANIPAKNIRYGLTPFVPGKDMIGPLKDMAQDIIMASSRLEGKVAPQTSNVLGDKLRFINSYYSNLIEGHKTSIADIEAAMQNHFDPDPDKKYAQELCVAHVQVERDYMQRVKEQATIAITSQQFLCALHGDFYRRLPEDHLYTHTGSGFSQYPVNPGKMRDVDVTVDGRALHGPRHQYLSQLLQAFHTGYDLSQFHGDERLIAMAASHHRLTWLHPFRDGNGRVARLHSGLFLAACDVNKNNLWSLSRGLSRNKEKYMFELWATDTPAEEGSHFFDEGLLADFCEFFFEICLDQIHFMEDLLRLDQIEMRIDWYVESRRKKDKQSIHPQAAKLLRAVFMRGSVARGKTPAILNMSERNSRRVVKILINEGLLHSKNHRAPLTIGLPLSALPFYFPDLYDPSVIGSEHIEHFLRG